MTIRNFDRLLTPQSVALIGASPQPGSIGRIVTANLLAGGFKGEAGLSAELAAKGTRAALVITAGIRGKLAQSMLDAACRTCFRIQGPNCLGLMVPGIGLNASFSHRAPRAGNLAFVSQSGG